jgi:ribose 5-phosphate isomerase B
VLSASFDDPWRTARNLVVGFHGMATYGRVRGCFHAKMLVLTGSNGGWLVGMSGKTVAVGSDHAGYEMKGALIEELRALGCEVLDLGCDGLASVDYPDFGKAVAKAVAEGRAERGVLVCGTGIGISIAANRNPRARAAVCHDETSARLAREHNDANILALGARLIGPEVAKGCVRVFLATDFAGGRHAARVAKLGN